METDRLSGVEIRHLRALLAVRDASSFSRAADRLGYAQSAVSQQIAALERAVGTVLVDRPGGPRPVSLTEAGRVLARHAEHVVEHMVCAGADLHALSLGEAGSVRIGTFQSAGARVLPRVLAAFRGEWPSVELELEQRQDETELMNRVAAGDLDVSFGILGDEADPRLVHRVLLDDPYVLVAPPGSPLAGHGPVRLAELDGRDMIAFRISCSCQAKVEELLHAAGARPNVLFRTDDNLTVQRLVSAGLGHAVMPELTVERGPYVDPVLFLPIAERVPPRQVAIFAAADRSRSPAVRAFIETATGVFAAERLAA